jgi:predicted nucleic acid-binding protein
VVTPATHSGFVADASVAAKWYLRDEELLVPADRFLSDWSEGRLTLFAPGHLVYEVTHAILKARGRGRISGAVAEAAVGAFAELSAQFSVLPSQSVVVGGAQLAAALGVNFFDACYLQAARNAEAQLVTADAAFYRQTQTQPDVLWLGDYHR